MLGTLDEQQQSHSNATTHGRVAGFAVLLIGVVALTMAALAPGKAAEVLGKAEQRRRIRLVPEGLLGRRPA